MAPPDIYPQGMTLKSIGYAALKYPDLYPALPIPIGNQIGVLQRLPNSLQNHAYSQIGSQYLSALIAYQVSDAAPLHDPKDAQSYLSSALTLLNFLTASPDICVRIATEPRILQNVIDKLLEPELESKMRPVPRRMGATFEDEFGNMLQFVSTMLLYPDHLPSPPHPRLGDLTPKLKVWARKHKGKFIEKVSLRLVEQIDGSVSKSMISMMRSKQLESVVCGVQSCTIRKDLVACGTCKIQRYCGQEHQRKDWKFHKHICNKGLVEDQQSATSSRDVD